MLSLDKIEQVEQEYGTPFYLFDEEAFVRNYKHLEEAFTARYPKYRIAYSFKTNYTPYVVDLVRRLGGLAEVVSPMELDLAREMGFAPERIVYNGPIKGSSAVEAMFDGVLVHADSLDEVEQLCAGAMGRPEGDFKIGLRVNLDIGQSFVSRFGMDEVDLAQALALVSRVENLRVAGLHCHISRCRDVSSWRRRAEKVLSLVSVHDLRDLEYVDLGSGMYGDMDPRFAAQFDNVPSYEEYAEAVTSVFLDFYGDGDAGDMPYLMTEPGTTLINRYISFCCRVFSVKEIRGQAFVTTNGSMHNIGEVGLLKRLPLDIVRAGGEAVDVVDAEIVGYTCLEQDVLYAGFSGAIAKGDALCFGNVGGYSNVLKPPFIRPNCSMVAMRGNGDFALMKAAESNDDIFGSYVKQGAFTIG